nr:hypothetical protein [Mucilaginibacter sp. L294]
MKKAKYLSVVLLITMALSSCGIFKKDCNCPHFSNAKAIKNHTHLA